MTRQIHIIARKNGVGIDRDVALLGDTLRTLGEVDWRNHHHPEPWLNQLRAAFASPDPSQLFLLAERVPRLVGRLPGMVALVPNQERFPRRHLRRLRQVHCVLCKTRHAEEIFRAHAPDVRYLGFTSQDRQHAEISPDYNKFFHLAGKSTLKGTQLLVDLWKQHPTWPELTIVQSAANAPPQVPRNVRLITEYLTDASLRELQNAQGVHLCPSLSEGWGHYLVEGMSCGAVVVTTDGPPMHELVQPDRGVLVPWQRSAPRHLGTNWHVDPQALEASITHLLDMPTQDKQALGHAARNWFVANDARFRARLPQVAAALMGWDRSAQAA